MGKPVILTGLRANSEFHIGNYLGAILPVVELQRRHAGEYQVNMFIPDLHSFTTPIDHTQLQRQIMENLKVFVAAGLDINSPDTHLYRQSYISAHSELTWILDCFTGFGELSRMTQFKDKSEGQKDDHVSVGLFNYPVLMAADVLLYGATWVPVGEDQRQHLELMRDLAIRLNNKFEQDLFVVPEEWSKQLEFAQRDNGIRIRSLRNPEKKMSKSVADPAGTIMITDDPEEAAKKVMSATTDSFGEIQFDFAERPGITNLLQMLALLTGTPQNEVNMHWVGKSSYGDLKSAVADAVRIFLTDFQAKRAAVSVESIIAKLEASEHMVSATAQATLLKVQQAVGLRPPNHG
jgi:tryptophanyl-tRNA synthetase